MKGTGLFKVVSGTIILLACIMVAAIGFRVGLDKGEPDAEFFRQAARNTLSLANVSVVEEVAFPASDKLMSMAEARSLGTGLWERTIEFTSPDVIHYISSSEDSEFEGYRRGDDIIFRTRNAGDGKSGPWHTPSGNLGEETDSEIQWMKSFKGISSLFEGDLLTATDIRKVREEILDKEKCVVMQFRLPAVEKKFKGPVSTDGESIDPVKYEVRAWIAKSSKPVIRQVETMYVYKSRDSGLYEYSVGKRIIHETPDLEIRFPTP